MNTQTQEALENQVKLLRAQLTEAQDYHDAIGKVFLAPGQTPYKICKQVWALHAAQSTKLAIEETK